MVTEPSHHNDSVPTTTTTSHYNDFCIDLPSAHTHTHIILSISLVSCFVHCFSFPKPRHDVYSLSHLPVCVCAVFCFCIFSPPDAYLDLSVSGVHGPGRTWTFASLHDAYASGAIGVIGLFFVNRVLLAIFSIYIFSRTMGEHVEMNGKEQSSAFADWQRSCPSALFTPCLWVVG